MTLLFISETSDSEIWKTTLNALMPELEIRVWPNVGHAKDIDTALVWKPPSGELARLPNLKLILSLGMGVDHIFSDPKLPTDIPIARLVDDNMCYQMSEYICCQALHHHRLMSDYECFQKQQRWDPLPLPDTAKCTVGILGLGTIGQVVAGSLMALGFPVIGWSRSLKSMAGVESFHGSQGLTPFLNRSNILACLLPLTTNTKDILNTENLSALPQNAYVINCARGEHLVEEDLLAALDRGYLAGAALDVFRHEPLPPEHPFWNHPKVRITPHIAGLTNPRTSAPQIVENIRRLHDGRSLINIVDKEKGY